MVEDAFTTPGNRSLGEAWTGQPQGHFQHGLAEHTPPQ